MLVLMEVHFSFKVGSFTKCVGKSQKIGFT